MNKLKTLKNTDLYRHYGALAFLLGLVLSGLLIIPAIIRGGGIFFYYGDFNAQEIPFYQMVHDAVKSGNLFWSSTTDLGSQLLGSYTFYLLGSPFFWITLPFPSEVVPYLMGPLFILKFGCASLTSYLYLKRYVNNRLFAVAGGLLYAFSGFSIYNIFFFHFHEPMIVFPLLLMAVDKFMYENKRGILAIAVFASCIVNYYFFAGMALFVAVYWLMLLFTDNYKLNIRKLLLFIFEVLLGFLATAFVILPTVLFLSGNPRLSSLPDGFDTLVYDVPQRYLYIILSFFFPPELAAQPNFTPDVKCNWASVSGWLPLVGMTGVIGYLQLRQRNWLKKLITLLMLMALIPVFNSAFQMFNSSIYYARWYYMLVLMLSLCTVMSLENKEIDWNRAIRWSVGITLGIALLIGIMPNTTVDDNDIENTVLGLSRYLSRYWIYVAIAMFSLLLFVVIIKLFRNHSNRLAVATISGIVIISLLSSTYIIQTGVSLDGKESQFLKDYAVNTKDNLEIDDINQVRSDFYECVDNLAMYWQIPSMNAFHSVVPSSIMEFYESIGITRDVASRPSCDYYGLRGLFSCKYVFDESFDDKDSSFTNKNKSTKMSGYKYLKTVNGCRVFENEHYIPMGFMYDSFIPTEEYELIQQADRSEALLKAMVLSMEDMERYSDITGYTKEKYKPLNYDLKNGKTHTFNSVTDSYEYGSQAYFNDCEPLIENSCDSFSYNSEGFEATVNNTDNDNLLFFSVPYNKGWSATVNGREVEIVKANIGFMAVRVPSNQESKIIFKYTIPGFHSGIIISVICGIIFFMYIFVLFIYKKRKSNSKR